MTAVKRLQMTHRNMTVIALLLFQTIALAEQQQLNLTGSSTVAPLALEIAKRYEQLNPGVRIDVQTGGSTRGIIDVRRRLADIGMVSRRLKVSENDLEAHTIGLDGISIILHRENPVQTLSDEQIIKIYKGKITNWSSLGGLEQSITVVNKAEGRSTLALFLEYFDLKNSQIKPDVVIGDNQQGIKTVAGNKGAIGYVSIGTAEYEQAIDTSIKRLPMAGVEAETASVRNGLYPLSRELNLVTQEQYNALVKNFIDFSQSPAVIDLIEAQYFVPPTNR